MEQAEVISAISDFFSTTFKQDEEPCKLLLQQGLYKYYDIKKTGDFSYDLKEYLKSETFKRDFKDGKWGGALGFVIDGAPIELKADASDQRLDEFRSLVDQSRTLSVSSSFYDSMSTRIPDVELAKQYTDCVIGTRQWGFKVLPQIGEKDVTFVISFNQLISTDPMPEVQFFEIKNGQNIKNAPNVGDILKNNTIISCDRVYGRDLILNLETTRGIATYRVLGDTFPVNTDIPIGTIIASFLDFDQFNEVSKNNIANPTGTNWTSKYSKWSPADGRPVPNSKFEEKVSQETVPDLRGVFLRGLNQFDIREVSLVNGERKDPENRVRGSFQKDEFRRHNHSPDGHPVMAHGNQMAGMNNEYPYHPQGVKEIIAQGGEETRPKNVAVYYYIRIN